MQKPFKEGDDYYLVVEEDGNRLIIKAVIEKITPVEDGLGRVICFSLSLGEINKKVEWVEEMRLHQDILKNFYENPLK